ncbi:hypothetical protein CQZ93_06335 [Ochrobactrum vermis]|nr:hypothetical protein CQZ93_06335 [Ochrobactrum vermis]
MGGGGLLKDRDYDVLASKKLHNQSSWVLERSGIIYLRIVGNYPVCRFMTATADEDDLSLHVCRSQKRLLGAAEKLCKELGCVPVPTLDNSKDQRPYLKMFGFDYTTSSSEEQAEKELLTIFDCFFKIYDSETDL